MGIATNIVLADAQATPVNHTFVPVGPRKDGFFMFEDQSASSPVGYNTVEVRMRRIVSPTRGKRAAEASNTRIDLRVKTPKLETLGTNSAGFVPSPTVAYVPTVDLSIVISDRAAALDRKDLRKYIWSLLDNAQIKGMVEDQLPIW